MDLPRITKPIKSQRAKPKRTLCIPFRKVFTPQDGTLHYEFIGESPDWLFIHKEMLVLLGTVPAFTVRRKYWVQLQASNEAGKVICGFLVDIVPKDFIEALRDTLLHCLSHRGLHAPWQDILADSPDLLAAIYEYLMTFPETREALRALLQKEAAKR